MKINVEYLDEALSYIDEMPEKARKKMLYNVSLVSVGVMNDQLFKKLTDSGIWEFRAEYEGSQYRLLSFWDKTRQSLIVATCGFDKKTKKTPKKEITHAEQIRNEYYKTQKQNENH